MKVDVALLQEAFKKSDITPAELARRLNWMERRPDSARAMRRLGIYPYYVRGRKSYNKTVDYDQALKIAEAIGVDPTDVGL